MKLISFTKELILSMVHRDFFTFRFIFLLRTFSLSYILIKGIGGYWGILTYKRFVPSQKKKSILTKPNKALKWDFSLTRVLLRPWAKYLVKKNRMHDKENRNVQKASNFVSSIFVTRCHFIIEIYVNLVRFHILIKCCIEKVTGFPFL